MITSAAFLVTIVLVAPAALADRITDAEDLFRRAKALMAQDKHGEACPLLAESYRLDPGMGTLLNLALCHESVGKTASAWGEFRAVEQQARAAVPPNEARVQLAREHAERLQSRLSRVRFVVPDSRASDLVLKLDGEPKAAPLWAGVPVDPGTHVLEVSASGKLPLVVRFKIDDEGVLETITVPALIDAPPVVKRPPNGQADLAAAEIYETNHARRTAGVIVALPTPGAPSQVT